MRPLTGDTLEDMKNVALGDRKARRIWKKWLIAGRDEGRRRPPQQQMLAVLLLTRPRQYDCERAW